MLAPQTDRGWARYDFSQKEPGPAKLIPGLGDGNRLALEIVDKLCVEHPIDKRRIYVTGQSMGGLGVWNMTAHRQGFFAAAGPRCASAGADNPSMSKDTPVWAFHGDSDKTVPVTVSRSRIAALKKAGAHPLYTEYAGIGHEVWELAYTEPALVRWMFSHQRG